MSWAATIEAAMVVRARQSSGGKTGQRRAIDLDTEPRTLRYANDAGDMLDRLRQNSLANGMLRPVELQHRLERRKRGRRMGRQDSQQLERRRDGNTRAPDMRI